MAMVIIAPVVAPIIGSLLLKFASWRAIFFTLAGFGIVAFLVSIPLAEPLVEPFRGSSFRAIGRLFVVLKNPGFSLLLGIFSSVTMPLMAFVASSSYVYIQGFGLTEQTFSLFFAVNAVSAMLGPLLYIRLSNRFHPNAIISSCFLVMAGSGILVASLGPLSPFVFAACMLPATMSITGMRPPSANLLLEQQNRDTGSASSLINFVGMIMGSVGMLLISLGTSHLVFFIGIIQVATGSLGYLFWMAVKNRSFIVQTR
jgi:DHA1 family bicyclomycin/chloramphenicol resistance-like MFS transporter